MRLSERLVAVKHDAAAGDVCRVIHRHAANALGIAAPAVAVVEPTSQVTEPWIEVRVTDAWVPVDAERFAVLTAHGPILVERHQQRELSRETLDGHGLIAFSPDVPPGEGPVPGRAELLAVATAALAGLASAALDRAVSRVSERVQFGRPLSSLQVVRHRLADALVDVEACDLAAAEAASAIDRGEPDSVLVAQLAKLTANLAAERVVAAVHQVSGGAGYLEDGGLGPITRSIIAASAGIGSSKQLRRAISERVALGRVNPDR